MVKTTSDSFADDVIDVLNESHMILPSIIMTAPRPEMGQVYK